MSYLDHLSDEELRKIVQNYIKQIRIVEEADKKINELKSKKKNKKEEAELDEMKRQFAMDEEDLRKWKADADEANKLLKQREMKKVTMVEINRTRTIYFTLVKRWLSHALSPQEILAVESSLKATTSKEKMKRIYDIYREKALNRVPSTQAMTSEEIEQIGNPLEEMVPTIQAFARSKISQKVAQGKHPLVQPKPPKSVSKPSNETQTSQTQTLVPLNAFKFIEKGENRFLEPMTPEKAEELAMKKKSIKSVTILNGNRFKRKPYIIYSRAH